MTSDTSERSASLGLLGAALGAYSLAHLFNNTVLELAGPKHALSHACQQPMCGHFVRWMLVSRRRE